MTMLRGHIVNVTWFVLSACFSVQLRPVSIQALLATCALGILHQDLALTLGALKELKPHRDDPDFLHHIAIFHAYSFFFKVCR